MEDDRSLLFILFDLIRSPANNLYIYPLPLALSCNGTVSAMRYCYNDNELGADRLIFTLLILEQNGLNFTVRDVSSVHSTPTSQICTRFFSQYCCDVFTLNAVDHFSLPAADFAFGIATSDSVDLLGFDDDDRPQYRVEQYILETVNLDSLTEGSTVSVDSGSRTTTDALRLFQFFISKLQL